MSNGFCEVIGDGYLIEPLTSGPGSSWEGHHATNPSAIRLKGSPHVFLGYRAGGLDDLHFQGSVDVWASHLGLAVLSVDGSRVEHRLPLPIMTMERGYDLPKNAVEYERFKDGPYAEEINVLHDFRLWEDGEWLYCIYHAGPVNGCYDCIVRMKSRLFLEKVARSIELADGPLREIRGEWRSLWWEDGVWQPCGIGGTNRIYGSEINKNDIVFIRLADGSLRMIHRPIPDNYIVDTGGMPYCPATADGILKIGSVQQSVRPGMRDNSHIGNNGMPSRAWIGEREVYIDLLHGVQNHRITDLDPAGGWDLEYLAYARVLDYETGEQLYYSDEPVFESDEPWTSYCRDGAWVSKLDHLRSVMFVGGQVPADPGETGLDATWYAYVGVGDTAVALASFTVRGILPPRVVEDIMAGVDRPGRPLDVPENRQRIGVAAGWEFYVRNNPFTRRIEIERVLVASGERGARPVPLRPGRIDAYAMWIGEDAVSFDEGLGWMVETRVKSSESGSTKKGILVLDRENPERIFYRSSVPGCTVPEKVRLELAYIYQCQPMARDGLKWLERKVATLKPTADVCGV